MKIIGLIQAREGSARFPGKVLEKIGDKSILAHCYERSKRLPLDEVIVVTGPESKNRRIVRECQAISAPFYCYEHFDESNVMLRFLYAGILHEADYILRICSDAPFFDIELNNKLIKQPTIEIMCHEAQSEYFTYYETGKDIPCIAYIPKGHFKELFSLSCLFRAYKDTLPADREHVTKGIWTAPEKYKIKRIDITHNDIELLPLSDINVPSDLKEIKRLYDKGIIK